MKLLLLILGFLAVPSELVWGQPTSRLTSHSPLATDGTWLYAVAENETALVRRPLRTGKAWKILSEDASMGRITALAYANGSLYVGYGDRPAVYRIDVATGQSQPVYEGAPLRRVHDIAVAGELLFISDLDRIAVLRLDRDGVNLESLTLDPSLLAVGPHFLASSGEDLVVSVPNQGIVAYVERIRSVTESRYTVVQKTTERERKPEPYQRSAAIPETAKSRYPEISSPGAVTVDRGILYVMDERSQQVFALSLHSRHPVRVVQRDSEIKYVTRLLVAGEQMFLLDGERGQLEAWPRVVPADVNFELSKSETMAAFYEYLLSEGVLPTKGVELRRNLEFTWRSERALLKPWVKELNGLACSLSPSICRNGIPRQILPSGLSVVVPDIPSESYIGARRLRLDGTRTLGAVVDRGIYSVEFQEWKAEGKLRQMNPGATAGRDPFQRSWAIREQKAGTYVVPVELVRYTVAIPASAFRDDSKLAELLKDFPSLSVYSQEELRASPRSALLISKDAKTWDALKLEYRRLKDAINYLVPDFQRHHTAYIGVAEAQIDCKHPDIGLEACSRLPGSQDAIPASAAVPPPLEEFKIKESADLLDHGTMVAFLIGGRRSEFGGQGLAPRSVLVPMNKDHPAIANDIRSAFVNKDARIFNISHRFGYNEVVPGQLRAFIDDKDYQDALFVVAAGNDDRDVCSKPDDTAYPVCWGDRPHVIVVGATDQSGEDFLPRYRNGDQVFGGSNWSTTYVHVASPGEGFHVAGRNRTYVPARGTSFATPLVTATAALLYEQGIIEPWLIKQRIISTADQKDRMRGRIYGGVLNVKRAVTLPTKTLLVKHANHAQVVELEPGQELFLLLKREHQNIPFRNIRRITATGTEYRIAYVRGVDDKQLTFALANPVPERPWKFHYFELDEKGNRKPGRRTGDMVELKDFIGAVK